MIILTKNGKQVGHGEFLCSALNVALDNGHRIHPQAVMLMYNRLHNGTATVASGKDEWTARTEKAMTAGKVRDLCESGVGFGEVQNARS